MRTMKSGLLGLFLLGIALGLAFPASAQDEEASSNIEEQLQDRRDDEKIEMITITGSRIRRKEFTTAAPVSVIGKMEMEASGQASIGDILQKLPSQGNAINIQANNGGNGTTRVNLRSLGPNRTLVLVNGRRHVPGGNGADASVDLNAIPVAVIERVEVLKDGASALYGSDAIGGVVNIITKKNYTGIEANAYVASSQHGGGTTYDLSVTSGTKSDRGNLVFSANYYKNEPVWAHQRNFADYLIDFDWDCYANPTEGCNPTPWLGSSRTPEGMIGGASQEGGNDAWRALVTAYPDWEDHGGWFHRDPVLGWRPVNWGGTSDPSDPSPGDLYNYQPENYLYTPAERYSLYSTGRYNFFRHLNGYFESSYTARTSEQKLAPEPLALGLEGIVVSADNYYNPFGKDFFDMRRRMVEGGHRVWTQNGNTFRFVGGLDGSLPEMGALRSWYWDVSWNYGLTQNSEMNSGRYNRPKVANALGPSFVDSEGIPRCGTGPDNMIEGCVPLDFFSGAPNMTQEMIDYISYRGAAYGFTEQTSMLANLTGELFEIPFGGMVAVAMGYEYREMRGGYDPNPLEASGDTTGNKSEPTQGGYHVNEFFAELQIPLIANLPLIEMFELSAAFRSFHYSTFGGDYTWKLGTRWQLTEELTARGTYSTAFRAPSVGELYSGAYDDFPYVRDPCTTNDGRERTDLQKVNCTADGVPEVLNDPTVQLLSRAGGNTALEPETADIVTVGLVYSPDFISDLSLTLDYFQIKVDNAINTIGNAVILNACYNTTDVQAERDLCDRIHRNNAGFINYIDNRITNIGGVETAGIDFQLRYNLVTAGVGTFWFNLEGTWLLRYDQIQGRGDYESTVEGLNKYDLGVNPDLRANLSVIWALENWGAGLTARFVNRFDECKDDDCQPGEGKEVISRTVEAYHVWDLFVSYGWDSSFGDTKCTLGVNNVLDREPPIVYNAFLAPTDNTTYDLMGRLFYVRLAQTF